MPKINFIFIIHFHQPTGQLEWILEKIYNNSYKLLLDIFKMFTDIKIAVHISGPLLLEMNERYPEWIDGIAKLAEHGTIELLAGSIGEAILPLLPPEDRYYQVKEYIKVFNRIFGFKPKGMWLPERVWEPSLPEPLARNGIEYVVIDDSTLYRGGRGGNDSLYAWITEDGGHPLKILFIDTQLRYILPWRSHEEVFNYMLSRADEKGERYLLWGSDAEKFGEWHDPKWAREWLVGFFSKLRGLRHEIETIHPSTYLEKYGVKGLIYLPSGSYDKMLEWSGGFFRNFLIKYRESNNLHKKMLRVRMKLKQANVTSEDIWRLYHLGQCNDAFWHGLFGGIYLTPLRQALYENLIKAEVHAEEAMEYYGESKVIITRTDFDYDGRPEILVETPLINTYFKPSDGGTLFELDYKEHGFEHNLLNTMSRYQEPYLDGTGFRADWYRRVSLREHLWAPYASIDDWVNNTPFIDKSDLALAEYKPILENNTLILRTLGHYYPEGAQPIEVFVEKRIKFNPSEPSITISYKIENQGRAHIDARLGIEFTLAPKLPRLKKEVGFIGYTVNGIDKPINDKWVGETNTLILKSPVMRDVVLETSSKTEFWVSPINMPSRTEKGIQENFEGLGVMPVYRIMLSPGDEFRQTIRLVFMKTNSNTVN